MIFSVPNTDKKTGEIKQYINFPSLYRVCEYEYGQYSDCVSNIYGKLGGERSDLVTFWLARRTLEPADQGRFLGWHLLYIFSSSLSAL